MTIQDQLKQNVSLNLDNGVFYQTDLANIVIRTIYLSLRKKENRLYSDEVVKHLPDVPANHKSKHEWTVAKHFC
jgi:hypothetical protein